MEYWSAVQRLWVKLLIVLTVLTVLSLVSWVYWSVNIKHPRNVSWSLLRGQAIRNRISPFYQLWTSKTLLEFTEIALHWVFHKEEILFFTVESMSWPKKPPPRKHRCRCGSCPSLSSHMSTELLGLREGGVWDQRLSTVRLWHFGVEKTVFLQTHSSLYLIWTEK